MYTSSFSTGQWKPRSRGKTKGTFINKLICKPHNHIARAMLDLSIKKNKPYGLNRLGISMHVYADAFAHRSFAGVNHAINEVTDLNSDDTSLDKGFLIN